MNQLLTLYAQNTFNAHADVPSSARGLYYTLSKHVHKHFLYSNSECLASSLTCAGSPEPSLIADTICTNISFVVQYVSDNILFFVEVSYATTLELDQDYTPALDNPDSPTYKSLKEEIESEVCVRLMSC